MKSTLIILVGIAAAISSTASGQNLQSGAGTYSCGDFGEWYRTNPRAAEDFHYFWAQGFMSGLNEKAFAEGLAIRDLGAMEVESQQSFLRSYCNANPLATYSSAVKSLYEILPEFPSR